ncbi:MAG TPA: FxsA family protein [Solirubrobacteraceae bacterium]|nr:FxsA family protein [Solirubrobacteraceae bacterium]
MPFLLVALFILVPIAELAVIIQVGQAIGVWWTILLLVADSILGSLLMRSQGRVAWRRFNEAVRDGRVPAREVADGVLVIFGGALLLTPGFLTDVFGVLFLLPPTRALIRRVFLRQAMKRISVSMAGMQAPPSRARRSDDVEGTAVDVDARPGSRPGLEA